MDIDNDLLCFFNFRSPYAYIGIKKAIDLGLKPVFLPFCYVPKEILEAVTLNNPYKKDYLLEDCKRLFDEEKINLVDEIPADCNWPKVHAAWHIVNENNLDLGLNFMLKAFELRFQKGLNIGNKDTIITICNDIGFNSELAINAMEDEEIDNYLKSLTKIMRELKVFGVPTLVYKKERFWGQDRLPYLKSLI